MRPPQNDVQAYVASSVLRLPGAVKSASLWADSIAKPQDYLCDHLTVHVQEYLHLGLSSSLRPSPLLAPSLSTYPLAYLPTSTRKRKRELQARLHFVRFCRQGCCRASVAPTIQNCTARRSHARLGPFLVVTWVAVCTLEGVIEFRQHPEDSACLQEAACGMRASLLVTRCAGVSFAAGVG